MPLTATQTAFVGFVIILLPLIGAGLLWTKLKRAGAWLITLSMLASLLFGFLNHFVLDAPDYVLAVPAHAWRYSFILSAALLVVTETIGTVIGYGITETDSTGRGSDAVVPANKTSTRNLFPHNQLSLRLCEASVQAGRLQT